MEAPEGYVWLAVVFGSLTMAISKCPRCKKLFEKRDKCALPVCPNCEPEERADYERIRETLDNAPHLKADEIASEARVDGEVVVRMLEPESLRAGAEDERVKCRRCGAPATRITMKLCKVCLEIFKGELEAQQSQIKAPGKKR